MTVCVKLFAMDGQMEDQEYILFYIKQFLLCWLHMHNMIITWYTKLYHMLLISKGVQVRSKV